MIFLFKVNDHTIIIIITKNENLAVAPQKYLSQIILGSKIDLGLFSSVVTTGRGVSCP